MKLMIKSNYDYNKYLNLTEKETDKIRILYWIIKREIPFLPNNLIRLDCYHAQLTILPPLPNTLVYLYCWTNRLTSLTSLDSCGAFLPLPNGLIELYCGDNQPTNLPSLPSGLIKLNCNLNQLTSLLPLGSNGVIPSLPFSLTELACGYNQLTNLPSLPTGLTELYCSSNPLLYFPYDIPKFGIQRNVNKMPIIRKVIKKFRDKLRIKREKELLFLPLPIPLIKMICEFFY